jgi:hypothetical protein
LIGRTQISRGEDRVTIRIAFKFRFRLLFVMNRSEPDSLGREAAARVEESMQYPESRAMEQTP